MPGRYELTEEELPICPGCGQLVGDPEDHMVPGHYDGEEFVETSYFCAVDPLQVTGAEIAEETGGAS